MFTLQGPGGSTNLVSILYYINTYPFIGTFQYGGTIDILVTGKVILHFVTMGSPVFIIRLKYKISDVRYTAKVPHPEERQ